MYKWSQHREMRESVVYSGNELAMKESYLHDKITRLGNTLLEIILHNSDDEYNQVKTIVQLNEGLSFQTLLYYKYSNSDFKFQYHQDCILDAQGLLGTELKELNCLHMVLINGDDELAEYLVSFLVDSLSSHGDPRILMKFLGQTCGGGNTPLHLASFFGMADIVKKLLELGVNPNTRNSLQYKPVDCADSDETRNLFQNLESLNRHPLLSKMDGLVFEQNLNLVLRSPNSNKVVTMETPELTISDTSSIVSDEGPILRSCFKKSKRSPDSRRVKFDPLSILIHACQSGDVSLAQRLLAPYISLPNSRRSLLNFQSPRRNLSLLHIACRYHQYHMVRFLISLNVNVNATDSEGWTPLHIACCEGDINSVHCLLESSEIKLDKLNHDGRAPWDMTNNSKILSLLHSTYLRHPPPPPKPSDKFNIPNRSPPRYCSKTLARRPALPKPPTTYSTATLRLRSPHS